MPRKKRTEDLKRRELALRDETLHIYRAIARDKKASPSLRLIATDRISAILGLLSTNIIGMYTKKRPPISEIATRPIQQTEEDLDDEVEQIAQWRAAQRGGDNANSASTEVRSDGSTDAGLLK